jgi:hypothetical protein
VDSISGAPLARTSRDVRSSPRRSGAASWGGHAVRCSPTTDTVLTVASRLDDTSDEKGIKVSDADIRAQA